MNYVVEVVMVFFFVSYVYKGVYFVYYVVIGDIFFVFFLFVWEDIVIGCIFR